ncbi:MAG: hypothetical protein NWE93_06800 [Candidatus Bathyarchaeota archaeon]|nr:hypothetical protein [Candidatus Bathyarchaeota archaeon]
MPLAALLGEMLKSGKVTLSQGNVAALEIKAADNKIDITALNKEFVKDTLAAARGTRKKQGLAGSITGTVDQIKSARSNLSMLRGVAEELSEAGVTVTLSYKDDVVVTVGSGAKPKLSSAVTGTKAIEINNPRKLIELGV